MSTVIGDEDSGWVSITTNQKNSADGYSTPYKEDLERLNYQGKESGKTLRNLTEKSALAGVTSTSPKSLDSSHKVPVNLCPASAIIAIALVIAQGHKKPGRSIFNWRSQKISYMDYHGAAMRHLLKSIDGSDYDKELSDLADVEVRHDWAAMSCLAIIEDARQAGTLVDDRPVKGGAEEFLEKLTVKK